LTSGAIDRASVDRLSSTEARIDVDRQRALAYDIKDDAGVLHALANRLADCARQPGAGLALVDGALISRDEREGQPIDVGDMLGRLRGDLLRIERELAQLAGSSSGIRHLAPSGGPADLDMRSAIAELRALGHLLNDCVSELIAASGRPSYGLRLHDQRLLLAGRRGLVDLSAVFAAVRARIAAVEESLAALVRSVA
jgi:hypothetical protein